MEFHVTDCSGNSSYREFAGACRVRAEPARGCIHDNAGKCGAADYAADNTTHYSACYTARYATACHAAGYTTRYTAACYAPCYTTACCATSYTTTCCATLHTTHPAYCGDHAGEPLVR